MCDHFREYLVEGVTINQAQLKKNIDDSLMMVTALSPVIGYDRAAQIAHRALDEKLTLKDAAIKSGVSETLYDNVVVPSQLTHPGAAKAKTARHGRP